MHVHMDKMPHFSSLGQDSGDEARAMPPQRKRLHQPPPNSPRRKNFLLRLCVRHLSTAHCTARALHELHAHLTGYACALTEV